MAQYLEGGRTRLLRSELDRILQKHGLSRPAGLSPNGSDAFFSFPIMLDQILSEAGIYGGNGIGIDGVKYDKNTNKITFHYNNNVPDVVIQLVDKYINDISYNNGYLTFKLNDGTVIDNIYLFQDYYKKSEVDAIAAAVVVPDCLKWGSF